MLEQHMLFGEPAESKDLRLLRLVLSNFKGVRSFTLDLPQGESVNVYGQNGTGKTTLFDAYTWLLADKDSANRKDFDIKTLDANNQPMHGLEHAVEATFALGSRRMTLRKVYAEQWTKKRGSAEKQFTGHTTDYFVDGVPCTKAEYTSRVASLIDEKAFRLLSDPIYFCGVLHWEERRRILLSVCGNVSDADVIASNSKLSALQSVLGTRSIDDHRKVIKARKAEVNKELEKIPVRISEVQRGLPDVSGVNADVLQQDIAKMQAAVQAKREALTLAQADGVTQKQVELSQVRAKLLDMETASRRETEDALRQKRLEQQDAQMAVSRIEQEKQMFSAQAKEHSDKAVTLATQMEQMRADWHKANSQQFAFTAESVCPTCGQALPEEQIEAAREKALGEFNLHKAESLEKISTEGKSLKQRYEQAIEAGAQAQNKVLDAEQRLTAERARVYTLSIELSAIQTRRSGELPAEYVRLCAERDAFEFAITQAKANSKGAVDAARAELATVEQALNALNRQSLQLEQHAQGQKRIVELQADEKRLAAEYEQLERETYLTEEFTRCKVRLLEDRINSRFQIARWKLFDVQVNGAIAECCEALCNGVPYGTNLNTGARINLGVDIINTLSEHYGMSVPVWIDNSESVTSLIASKAQVIGLVASEPDKALRIEREAN